MILFKKAKHREANMLEDGDGNLSTKYEKLGKKIERCFDLLDPSITLEEIKQKKPVLKRKTFLTGLDKQSSKMEREE